MQWLEHLLSCTNARVTRVLRPDMPASAPITMSERLFLVVVASLPIMQPWSFPFRGYTLPATDFIFLVAAAAAAWAWLRGRATLPRSPVLGALAIYGLALCAATAASTNRAHSVVKLIGSVYLIGLAALTMFHARSMDAFRRALIAWLVGTVITIAAAGAGTSFCLSPASTIRRSTAC